MANWNAWIDLTPFITKNLTIFSQSPSVIQLRSSLFIFPSVWAELPARRAPDRPQTQAWDDAQVFLHQGGHIYRWVQHQLIFHSVLISSWFFYILLHFVLNISWGWMFVWVNPFWHQSSMRKQYDNVLLYSMKSDKLHTGFLPSGLLIWNRSARVAARTVNYIMLGQT